MAIVASSDVQLLLRIGEQKQVWKACWHGGGGGSSVAVKKIFLSSVSIKVHLNALFVE